MNEEKNIEELLKDMNRSSADFFDNSWVFIVLLLMLVGFNNGKKEETVPIININIKGADLDV